MRPFIVVMWGGGASPKGSRVQMSDMVWYRLSLARAVPSAAASRAPSVPLMRRCSAARRRGTSGQAAYLKVLGASAACPRVVKALRVDAPSPSSNRAENSAWSTRV
jgi:hypothetical protein